LKIALVNNYAPFVYGGAEFLVDTLRNELAKRGHEVSLTRIPFPNALDHQLLTNALACRALQFDSADKVIAFKYPAYYVRHPDKVLWIFHQLRQVYELWETDYGLRANPDNNSIRELIAAADKRLLPEARRIFVNSQEVAGRLEKYSGIRSTVLYPPLQDSDKCRFAEYGDFLFYPSRVTSFKRQHLAIESMKHTRTGIRLVLAGRCEEPKYEERLRRLVDEAGLADRVTMLGWIEQEQKFDLMARALACLYLAFQEDSYGFVSMEAFYSRKAVIAPDDSGGTRELISDGVNGFIVPPDPEQLAERFDRLYQDRALARTMGENGFTELTSRDLTWDGVIAQLLS
jgi:glycosyltransferase involved in cell wall biosynthesis